MASGELKDEKPRRHPESGSVKQGENLPQKIDKDWEILNQVSNQGENKDIKFFIEERELVAVESKEIYKFHLGPGDKNLSLQIDKDLLFHIQGGEVRVVDLREKFRIPLADARQGENLAQQICIDQEIHIPGEPMNEELKEQPSCLLGSGPSKSEINRVQEIHIPAGGSGKSTDATPATRFYLPDASDDEMPSDGPMH
ncbi:uncharacterized protein LOC112202234 isoform X2 [Rosa chinensis]|uniref:uncharacterized protein LOC112202234 isoform X2 n=1 Tax=Rosa chinensis TaxID=74649 RepID=UPI000D087C51|nr:uncharacterized protein LOC112202234 isoform X2 [Rosa chinensis]